MPECLAISGAPPVRTTTLGLADAKALLFAGAAEDFPLPAVGEETLRALAIDRNRRRPRGERARMADTALPAKAAS